MTIVVVGKVKTYIQVPDELTPSEAEKIADQLRQAAKVGRGGIVVKPIWGSK